MKTSGEVGLNGPCGIVPFVNGVGSPASTFLVVSHGSSYDFNMMLNEKLKDGWKIVQRIEYSEGTFFTVVAKGSLPG